MAADVHLKRNITQLNILVSVFNVILRIISELFITDFTLVMYQNENFCPKPELKFSVHWPEKQN